MDKKIFPYVVFFILALSGFAIAGENQYEANRPNDLSYASLQGYTIYIPAGAKTKAVLTQDINSKTAVVGQTISAVLTEDFVRNGHIIASSGSVIIGSIVSNQRAGLAGQDAKMQIRFTAIRTPYNNIIPVSAVILTNDLSGTLRGKSLNAIQAEKSLNTDAYIPKPSNEPGVMHADSLGGGVNIAKAIIAKGENILIPSNSEIGLFFDQPITLGAQ